MPVRFANPFTDARGSWFKGNLHSHTTESDGKLTKQDVVEFYRSKDYHFLCLTDHEKVSDPAELSKDGFLVFTGVETSPQQSRHHLVGIGLHELGPFPKQETPQGTVDKLRSMGGLVFVAHPYWSALTDNDMRSLNDVIGIELYNTGCEVEIGRGFSTVHWDNLLASGMPLTGFAVDDAHRYTDDAPGGWVCVRAPRLSEKSILSSIAKGYFYASTGPEIRNIRIEEDLIRVETSPVDTITFHSRGPRGNSVHRIGEGMLTHAAYRFKPEHCYVRIECLDGGGRKAWSNPIYTDQFDALSPGK